MGLLMEVFIGQKVLSTAGGGDRRQGTCLELWDSLMIRTKRAFSQDALLRLWSVNLALFPLYLPHQQHNTETHMHVPCFPQYC